MSNSKGKLNQRKERMIRSKFSLMETAGKYGINHRQHLANVQNIFVLFKQESYSGCER